MMNQKRANKSRESRTALELMKGPLERIEKQIAVLESDPNLESDSLDEIRVSYDNMLSERIELEEILMEADPEAYPEIPPKKEE